MNIGFMGICILVILLCVPVYLIYFYKLNLQRKFALALAKVVGYLALTGIMLEFVFRMNNIALNILWVVLLALLTSVVTVNRARLDHEKLFHSGFHFYTCRDIRHRCSCGSGCFFAENPLMHAILFP